MATTTTTTTTVCYDLGGNSYYGIPSSGFCGSKDGNYTVARDEITCLSCRAHLSY